MALISRLYHIRMLSSCVNCANVPAFENNEHSLHLVHVQAWCPHPCYRHLGLPTFFPYPALSTVPLSVGHNNQWWRDLLRDLRPICRWWCSEHHLLRAESTASLLSHFLFILDSFISLSAWLCLVSLSHHHAYAPASAQLTHPLPLVIMLTLICHFCLLL